MRFFFSIVSMTLFVLWGCRKSESSNVQVPVQKDYLNVVYGSISNAQKLDIFLPNVGTAPYPVVVWIHGGGWVSGDKGQFNNSKQYAELTARGYAVVSINYRLSGEAKFPAQIYDVKAALRWLRANASTYAFDPDKIAVWGSSAGGHLSALAGTSGAVTELENLTLGNSNFSSRVQAVVDWFGPTDVLKMDSMANVQGCTGSNHNSANSPESALIGFAITARPDLAAKVNPIMYITNDDPPLFIAHGLSDCTVPYGQSQLLYDKLLPVIGATKLKLRLYPATGHGAGAFDNVVNIKDAVDFLDMYLK